MCSGSFFLQAPRNTLLPALQNPSLTPSHCVFLLPPLLHSVPSSCPLFPTSLPLTHTATSISVTSHPPTHSPIHSFTYLGRSQYLFALKSSNPLVKSQKRRRKTNQKSTGSPDPNISLSKFRGLHPKPRPKQGPKQATQARQTKTGEKRTRHPPPPQFRLSACGVTGVGWALWRGGLLGGAVMNLR